MAVSQVRSPVENCSKMRCPQSSTSAQPAGQTDPKSAQQNGAWSGHADDRRIASETPLVADVRGGALHYEFEFIQLAITSAVDFEIGKRYMQAIVCSGNSHVGAVEPYSASFCPSASVLM